MALQKLNAQTLEGDLDVVDITASGDFTLTSTASFKIPSGTTAQRGASTTGALRFNSTTSGFEGYDGTEWGTIGGGGLTDADEDTYITAEATADSDDLDFWTAGTKRMTIDQAGAVTILGDLTVSGSTTTIDSTTINVQTAFVFEGATADDYETTLAVTDPTADRTITLPDATALGTNSDSTQRCLVRKELFASLLLTVQTENACFAKMLHLLSLKPPCAPHSSLSQVLHNRQRSWHKRGLLLHGANPKFAGHVQQRRRRENEPVAPSRSVHHLSYGPRLLVPVRRYLPGLVHSGGRHQSGRRCDHHIRRHDHFFARPQGERRGHV